MLRLDLDEEARAAIPGSLDEQLRYADLVEAGWSVEVDDRDDGATVVVAKRFPTAEQLASVVHELSGEAGPFRDFRLERSPSRFRTRTEFSGTVELTEGVGAGTLDPADEPLAEELAAAGVDLEALRAFLNQRLPADAVSFTVRVALPGEGLHDAPRTDGGEPVWEPVPGERLEMEASSSSVDVRRVVLLATGILLAVLALAVMSGFGPLGRRRLPASRSG